MNRKLKGLSLIVAILLYATGCVSNSLTVSYKGSISPNIYGLQQAKTGEERYEILLRTHKEAVQKGLMVDYRGIDTINLTIPKGAESIPLGSINDFNGVVFNVSNQNKDVYLFSYVNKAEPIDVPAHLIDKGLFLEIPRLNSGKKLLVIEDQNPWVENRKGYSYGHIRRDILLLKYGKAQNQTIMPYDNQQSLPKCKVYDLGIPYIKIEKLILNRTDNSSYKTFMCNIVGTNNVQINNVTINTPKNDMVEDLAINIVDCTNVYFENVTINGTYSRSDYSGYGICMNNIWNFYAFNLYGNGDWGVFGNNNINVATLENCEINRFDTHCYGRDFAFSTIKFFKWYNQFSSVFGDIKFKDCEFRSFTPVLYEPSYNAINEHRLSFNDCTFYADVDHNSLIKVGSTNTERNSRPELNKKCWPQLFIKNLKVVTTSWKVSDLFLFNTSIVEQGAMLDTIAPIVIDGIEVSYIEKSAPMKVSVSNRVVESRSDVKVEARNICFKEINKSISIRDNDNIYVNIKKHK